MKSNRDLVEKTKPILKDYYFHVFICIVLASLLPQIISSVSPQNLYLNIAVVGLSGYIQLGLAVFCLNIFNKGEGEFTTIFNQFNSFKPVFFIIILSIAILLGFILLIIPGIIIALMYSQVFFILADDPDIGVIEAFNLSEKMMRNHKWQLFMLNLEAFLFFIAGIFTLFIWWVWLLPRYSIAYAGFYEELKKEFKH